MFYWNSTVKFRYMDHYRDQQKCEWMVWITRLHCSLITYEILHWILLEKKKLASWFKCTCNSIMVTSWHENTCSTCWDSISDWSMVYFTCKNYFNKSGILTHRNVDNLPSLLCLLSKLSKYFCFNMFKFDFELAYIRVFLIYKP